MIWQDAVIGIGQFLFSVALLPSIRHPLDKPARSTCFMTAAMLFVFSATYVTLSFWLAALSCTICACCWTVLLFQRRVM